jgi:class 3 adenylate cyclase
MKVIHGLVACSDLTGYARLAGKKSDEEIFQLLADYYEIVGDIIAPASGRVIKFMGDAALMLFSETSADAGVRALLTLQSDGDRFWAERGVACHHHIRAHFGPVCLGPIGTRGEKREDILGSTVNTLFLLKASGFAMTSEAFRKLEPETRKLFKKHTPPMTYIPTAQGHRD